MNNFVNPEQFAAVTKANIETLLALANSAFARAERLTTLNRDTARSVLEDGIANIKNLQAAKSPQDLTSLQANLAQPMVDKVVAYARSVYEIASEGQQEVSKVFDQQIADLNKTFTAELDKAAKAAPAGSEAAFAAVKSAVDTANSVYDRVSKAAKQVAEVAEANVAAATDATVKAVSASVKNATAK